jgi:hypothetical protein
VSDVGCSGPSAFSRIAIRRPVLTGIFAPVAFQGAGLNLEI